MTTTDTDITHGVVLRQAVYQDDLDGFGMLHHTKYALLFDHAVIDFWSEAGWVFDPKQSVFAIRDLSLRYRVPVMATGTLAVRFWIDEATASKATYRFEIRSDDLSTLHADGTRTIVNLDPQTLQRTPMNAVMWEAARPLLPPGFVVPVE
jgi:acyl-CoA thioester hydrolase